MNLKKHAYSDVILLQWPTCPRWLNLSYSIPCCSVQVIFYSKSRDLQNFVI